MTREDPARVPVYLVAGQSNAMGLMEPVRECLLAAGCPRGPMVHVAEGGTPLVNASYVRPSWHPARRGELYDRLVDEARRVFRETEADGGRARFAALFWVQGEQDTKTDRRGTGGESLPPPPQPEAALQYETNLRALIAALRRDLAAAAAELPVVIAGTPVGRAPDYALERSRHAATPAVVAAQQRVGATTPGAVYVPTEGVPRGDDGLHLTGEGGRLLAKRMVEAYVALCAQQARGGEEAS